MNLNESKEVVKKSWDWIWNSDSIWSWFIALGLIFLFVKFIFFPTLSLLTGSSLPLAGVESSSMDHRITKNSIEKLELCGNQYSKKEHINFNEYWDICGEWYEKKDISKEMFSDFTLRNGFSKGDIIIVWGRFEPKIGDIIIFKPNQESKAPRPIIHRIVKINADKTYQTKGDHNSDQLQGLPQHNYTDETTISKDQIIGKAIFKIPFLGWIKIWLTEFINKLTPKNFF